MFQKFLLSPVVTILLLIFAINGCGSKAAQKKAQNASDHASVRKVDGSIIVTGGPHGLNKVPVAVEWDETIPACVESDGVVKPTQVEKTSDSRLLWFMAEVPAKESRKYVPSQQSNCPSTAFLWGKIALNRSRLIVNDQPAIEYVYPDFAINRAEQTMKPFHHIYAPDGSQLITKGAGGKYSHHRGIFYGYKSMRYEDGDVNTWDNFGENPDNVERTEHVRFLQEWTGPVFGGHKVAIEWRNEDAKVIADEERTIRVYRRIDNELRIDVKSVLSSRVGSIALEGDLQHAGLQFRASQYVAEHPESSKYLRPEEWSDYPADKEMNFTEKRLDEPWNAFQFEVDGKPYTVGYFSHPDNPPGGQMSERLYGRFGEFIPGIVIDKDQPLYLKYRFLIISGHEVDRTKLENEYIAYTLSD